MSADTYFDPTGCIHCQAGLPSGSVLRTVEHGPITVTARVCLACQKDARWDKTIAASIISATLEEQNLFDYATSQINEAISELYQSDTVEDSCNLLAVRLGNIFKANHPKLAEIVAFHITTKILRGMEIECIGSVPGNAISEAMREFQ